MDETSDDAREVSAEGSNSSETLLPLVYDQLRQLARRYMRQERPEHTLQPTALVHEAYMRMLQLDRIDWRTKTHFFAVAATQMRRILVEHARAGGARKRGGRPTRITLEDRLVPTSGQTLEVLGLEEALQRLERHHPRQAKVAELRVFAGLRQDETARILGVSRRTVQHDWHFARTWLARELSGGTPP